MVSGAYLLRDLYSANMGTFVSDSTFDDISKVDTEQFVDIDTTKRISNWVDA